MPTSIHSTAAKLARKRKIHSAKRRRSLIDANPAGVQIYEQPETTHASAATLPDMLALLLSVLALIYFLMQRLL